MTRGPLGERKNVDKFHENVYVSWHAMGHDSLRSWCPCAGGIGLIICLDDGESYSGKRILMKQA